MKIDKGLVGGSTMMLVLSLLSERDFYGYEIIRELADRSDNTFEFKEGTLYPVLHKLENNGFLKSYMQQAETGKERKYYTITKKGLAQLEAEKEQWSVFSGAVNRVVLGEGFGKGLA